MVKYFVVDTETTGTDPEHDLIIDLAFLEVDEFGQAVGQVTKIMAHLPADWYKWADPRALEINGYTPDHRGTEYDEAKREFQTFADTVKGAMLIGANIQFDLRFIMDYAMFLGIRLPLHYKHFDIQAYAAGRKHTGQIELLSLSGLAIEFDIVNENPHDSRSDVLTTQRILERLLSK